MAAGTFCLGYFNYKLCTKENRNWPQALLFGLTLIKNHDKRPKLNASLLGTPFRSSDADRLNWEHPTAPNCRPSLFSSLAGSSILPPHFESGVWYSGSAQGVPRARRWCLICMRRCSVAKKTLMCLKLCQFKHGCGCVAKLGISLCVCVCVCMCV